MPNLRRGVFTSLPIAGLLSIAELSHAQAPLQKPGLVPAASKAADLRVRLELVGRMPTHTNPTSAITAGTQLLLLDQAGYLYRWADGITTALITPNSMPSGITLLGPEPLMNAAADQTGTKLYVMFMSSTAPAGVPRRTSPRDPDGWYVLYEYQFDDRNLSSPRPVCAMQGRSDGHLGGGMTVLGDGSVLFAVGDNGDSYEDGRDYSQNVSVHLAKIARINPADGGLSVAALGVRNAQRLAIYAIDNEEWLTFVDPGGWISEELNAARLTEVGPGAPPLNFGWGRNPVDRKSREGTFEIDQVGNSTAIRSVESGFVDPVTEFGRNGTEPVAISGPVHSGKSFSRIVFLFGDLVSGELLATTGPPSQKRQDVFRVGIVNDQNRAITLKSLTMNTRPDPRFFTFPDGSAGLLVERTGEFFRVSEVR